MPNYSNEQVISRTKDKKDAARARETDRLAAQATQPPHSDDAAAMARLSALAGDDSTGGYATNDARNYARMRLGQIGGPQMDYSEARDGRFTVGKGLGTLLRVGAPIAGSLIPGVGTLAGMAIGGLGNSAGQLLSKGNINPLESLAAGATPGLAKLGGRLMQGGSQAALGGGGMAPNAGVMSAGGGLVNTAREAGSSGLLGKIGGAVGKVGLGNIAKVGVGTAKFLGDRAQRKNAEQFAQSQLELKQRMLGMAEQDYGARAPLRDAAFSRLGAMARGPMGSSVYR